MKFLKKFSILMFVLALINVDDTTQLQAKPTNTASMSCTSGTSGNATSVIVLQGEIYVDGRVIVYAGWIDGMHGFFTWSDGQGGGGTYEWISPSGDGLDIEPVSSWGEAVANYSAEASNDDGSDDYSEALAVFNELANNPPE